MGSRTMLGQPSGAGCEGSVASLNVSYLTYA